MDATTDRVDDGVVVEVDARGMPCPRPIIELARAMSDLEVGQRVRLLADDPAAEVDVPVWCRMQRQQLVGRTMDGPVGVYVVGKLRDL